MKSKIIALSIGLLSIQSAIATHDTTHRGFLTSVTAPDSLAILPPPPAENTLAFLNDKAQYESGRALKGTERFALAARDANYHNFSDAFSEAYGMTISPKHTPVLYSLLENILADSHDDAVKSAKTHYHRLRPFVVYKNATCTPTLDNHLALTGSYPSGHASFGWAAALVLSEINPARKTQILHRGFDFGESRVICGAHWQSDVDNGRLMGASVIAALHANPQFNQQLKNAKAEFLRLNDIATTTS